MHPDVIVPSSNLVTTILQQETRTIPTVFVLVGDPVGSGYVASMAQPGGNITGFAVLEDAIAGKWVETLNEIAPQVRRVGFILHPETSANVGLLRAAEAAAPSAVKLIALGVTTRLRSSTPSLGSRRRPTVVCSSRRMQSLLRIETSSLNWLCAIGFPLLCVS
jgi:ABC-type uncharacterized transport system substrate-binding protein